MHVTIERFNTGGGWYIQLDGRTIAALLPSDIEYIAKRFGPTSKHTLVAKAVEQEYARQSSEVK